MGRPKKVPYQGDVGTVVVEVVDTVVSSSTIRDFHQNSFWQHHCDSIRKLYTNSGVHTVRSQKFHIHPTQMNSTTCSTLLPPGLPQPKLPSRDKCPDTRTPGHLKRASAIRRVVTRSHTTVQTYGFGKSQLQYSEAHGHPI